MQWSGVEWSSGRSLRDFDMEACNDARKNVQLWRSTVLWALLIILLGAGMSPSSVCGQRIYTDPHFTFFHNATEAPLSSKAYDYIIIGGGTAGCPLAATLSQNFTVLLLERGGDPYSNPLVETLLGFEPDLVLDTDTSPSQSFMSDDGVPNQRARVLGGGSSLNAGFFSYASPEYVSSVGWDGALVNQSFAWVAGEVADFPELQTFQTAARDALLEAGVTPYNGRTYEHLIGTKIGGSTFDSRGRRHSAADFLTFAEPQNITVFLWANVQQLLFANSSSSSGDGKLKPRAIGVVFRDLHGVNHTALLNDNANSEVILSAGALGSPQLLMLSGIGPPDHLAALKLPTILSNPSVGDEMADNPMNNLWVLTTEPVEISLIEVVGVTSFGCYIEVSSGQAEFPTSSLVRRGLQLVQKNQNVTAEKHNVTATELRDRIYEAIYSVPEAFQAQAAQGGLLLQKVWGPFSRGYMRLLSTDVSRNPFVRFNYYEDYQDLDTCTQGARTVLRALSSPAFARLTYTDQTIPLVLRPVKAAVDSTYPRRDLGNYTQDTLNINQWCKDSLSTIWHYHGGCVVGKVVDSEYRVMGVQSLRVIDGSTFTRSPGTNPQATLMMLGRYMGVQMLRERLGSNAGV